MRTRFCYGALAAVTGVACWASQPGDTTGFQRAGQWWQEAALEVEEHPELTVRTVRVVPGTREVLVAAIDFNPTHEMLGDEYSVSFGLDLGPEGSRKRDTVYDIGGPEGIRAFLGSKIGLGPVLKPDSIRGQFMILTRGQMQMVARVEAEFYYSHWDDSTNVVIETVRRRIDFVRPDERRP